MLAKVRIKNDKMQIFGVFFSNLHYFLLFIVTVSSLPSRFFCTHGWILCVYEITKGRHFARNACLLLLQSNLCPFRMNGILNQGMVSCYEHFRDEFDNKMGLFIPVWAIRPSTI